MEVHFKPEVQAKLEEMARESGCASDDLIEDAVLTYFDELVQARETLDRRYDEMESAQVHLIDGHEFFEGLRKREEELLKKSAK